MCLVFYGVIVRRSNDIEDEPTYSVVLCVTGPRGYISVPLPNNPLSPEEGQPSRTVKFHWTQHKGKELPYCLNACFWPDYFLLNLRTFYQILDRCALMILAGIRRLVSPVNSLNLFSIIVNAFTERLLLLLALSQYTDTQHL